MSIPISLATLSTEKYSELFVGNLPGLSETHQSQTGLIEILSPFAKREFVDEVANDSN